LDVLRFAKKRVKRIDGLLSWVPDWATEDLSLDTFHMTLESNGEEGQTYWRRQERQVVLTGDPDASQYYRHQAITIHCSPSFTLGENHTLSIKGAHFDTIAFLSEHEYPSPGPDFAGSQGGFSSAGNQPQETEKVLERTKRMLESVYD
jgi:hypothetical protein